jgi:hypothetical protein
MGRTYNTIDEPLAAFLRAQHVFFVGTAPRGGDGHVNVSPKGLDGFTVLEGRTVAYVDLTGSGIETIAHLRDNGRVSSASVPSRDRPGSCASTGEGGRSRRTTPSSPPSPAAFRRGPARAVIVIALDRLSDSCGDGVPRYRYEGERSQRLDWAERTGMHGLETYRAEHDRQSIDGLPGLPLAPVSGPPPSR